MAQQNPTHTDRVATLYAVTAALGTALTRAQVAQVLVEQGVAAMGAAAGSVALLDPSGDYLEVVAAVGYRPEVLTSFRRFPRSAPVPLADAVRTGQPLWIESEVAFLAQYPDLAVHQSSPPRAAWAALPLQTVAGTLGAVGLSFAAPLSFSTEDRAFITSVVHQCAQSLERARLYEVEQLAHRQADRLVNFSSALANSLDFQVTLHNIARLAVPDLGDACLVYLLDANGQPRPVAAAHVEPVRDERLQTLLGEADLNRLPALASVLRALAQGAPVNVGEGSSLQPESETTTGVALGSGQSALDLRHGIALPMIARGQPLGVLVLCRGGAGAIYSAAETALGREAAQSAAMALDNARLYSEARALAAELEQRVEERTQALESTYAEQRRLLQRLTQVREEERARLAREIYDQVGGSLAGLKMDLFRLKGLAAANRSDLPELLSEVATSIDGIVQEVRKIATELSPSLLDHFGLAETIEATVQEFQSRFGLDCHLFVTTRAAQLERQAAVTVYRVFQEALTNIVRHAQARQVWVRLEQEGQYLVLEVHDDGRGITEAELAGRETLGLNGMRERVGSLAGELMITGAPGRGTTVEVRVPT